MLKKTYSFKHILVASGASFEICFCIIYTFRDTYFWTFLHQTHVLFAFNLHLTISIQNDKIKAHIMHINMHCAAWVAQACLESDKVFLTLHKKWSFLLRIASVNVTKSADLRIWSHLLKKSVMVNSFFVQCENS